MPIPQRHKYEQHRKARLRNELEHERMVEAFLADLPQIDDEPADDQRDDDSGELEAA